MFVHGFKVNLRLTNMLKNNARKQSKHYKLLKGSETSKIQHLKGKKVTIINEFAGVGNLYTYFSEKTVKNTMLLIKYKQRNFRSFMKNLSLFNKENKKNIEFSKINIIFGYSKSGKTTFLKDLNSIFLGKNKHILINGTQTISGDFNVFYLNSTDGIRDHLKLSSKSLVRKLIVESQFSNDFNGLCLELSKNITKAKDEIANILKEVLPNLTFSINNIDNPLNLLIDNAEISLNIESSTEDKEELFSLVESLGKLTKTQTIVIIDDFNNDLDEEATINFFDNINTSDAYFILSTKRPIPQHLINTKTRIFTLRNFELIAIPPFEKLALESQDAKEENHSFEEYMLGIGYLKESNEYKKLLETINLDVISNILRILTSKNPVISEKQISGKVTIIPENKMEQKLYQYIFELLNLNNQ